MFVTLLVVTLAVALATSGLVIFFFRKPIRQILDRVIADPVAAGWERFLLFAVFVVGVSSGVQIWKLEQYLHPEKFPVRPGPDGVAVPEVPPLVLDGPSMALEVYRTIISTLQGVAWALLVFFVVALIAYAIVRRGERQGPSTPPRAA
ncbi:MAG: hypothetical protein ACREOU_06925 [Candidatus Eiseniibacteriota bacterium]